jgi:hypothetical protein
VGRAKGFRFNTAPDKPPDESLVQFKLSTLCTICGTLFVAFVAFVAGYHQLFLKTLLEEANSGKLLVTPK